MTTPTPRTDELKRAIWQLLQAQESEKVYAWRDAIHCGIEALERDLDVAQSELERVRDKCNEHYMALAAAQDWREAVLNELIVAHIYTKEHDTNPRKAIQDAITWNCQVALDPAVSSDARKLIAQERERCASICDEFESKWDPHNPVSGWAVACDCAAAIRRG